MFHVLNAWMMLVIVWKYNGCVSGWIVAVACRSRRETDILAQARIL